MPSNPKSRRKRKNTQNRASKPSKECDTAGPKLPITPDPLQTNSQESPYHCEITCKEEKSAWNRIKPFVEIAGVFLLAVYTGYTIKMYRANKKAADAARSAAETAQKTLKVQNRPWVYIPIAKGITTNQPLNFWPLNSPMIAAEGDIGYEIRNSGNSPGLNTIIISNLIVNRLPLKMPTSPCNKEMNEGIINRKAGLFIAPGDVFTQGHDKIIASPAFTPKDGPVYAVLQLCVSFRDEFGDTHGIGSNWQYVTPDGKIQFAPVGIVNGQWKPMGIGSVSY